MTITLKEPGIKVSAYIKREWPDGGGLTSKTVVKHLKEGTLRGEFWGGLWWVYLNQAPPVSSKVRAILEGIQQ